MKKAILYSGLILIILNSIIGFVLPDYKQSNVLLVDISLAISNGLIYGVVESKIVDGFRIGLSVLFILSGFIRVLVAFSSNEDVKDNFSIVILLVILAFEVICFVVSKFLDNK